ncbi:MAG: SRPBCC family protein [Bacteroidota bacterium]|nr:SRPBCC family protein [Bacteroidota bacterium]
MKLLKLGAVSIVVLFVIVLGISLLFPSKIIISRAVNIDASPATIMPHINNVSAWKNWVEGMNDTSVHIISDKVVMMNKTKATIVNVTDQIVSSEWINGNNRILHSSMQLIPDSSHSVTVVQWQFEQQFKWYPWEKFGSMVSDKIVGTMMEKNLNKLKQLAERKDTSSLIPTTEN